MKKTVIIIVLLLFSVSSITAQKGNILVTAQSSYSTYVKTVGIGFKGQYYFLDNLRVGPSVSYYFNSENFNALVVSASAQYILNLSDWFMIYPTAGVCFSSWDEQDMWIPGPSPYDEHEYRFAPILGAGAELLFTRRFGIYAEYEYQFISDFSQALINLGFICKF
ncbi:MAG: outer membrane beta-barrel protein [Bacteroidales bacterium]